MISAWLPGSALERFSGQLTRRAAAPRSPAPRELITLPAAKGKASVASIPPHRVVTALRILRIQSGFGLCALRDVAQR
jgi:hypothetical protein